MSDNATPWFHRAAGKPTRTGVYQTCATPGGRIFWRYYDVLDGWSDCSRTQSRVVHRGSHKSGPSYWRGLLQEAK